MTAGRRIFASLAIAVFVVAAIVLATPVALAPRQQQSALPLPTALPSKATPAKSESTGRATTASASPTPTTLLVSRSAVVIDGIPCERVERLDYHVHAHLAIRMRGDQQPVPAGIGFGDGCLYWLHTHDVSGIIHVEAPTKLPFRLGQFFDVWGARLDRSNVGTTTAEVGERVFAFVDGAAWNADLREIPLGAHAVVELQIGPAPLPPLRFAFPNGL